MTLYMLFAGLGTSVYIGMASQTQPSLTSTAHSSSRSCRMFSPDSFSSAGIAFRGRIRSALATPLPGERASLSALSWSLQALSQSSSRRLGNPADR